MTRSASSSASRTPRPSRWKPPRKASPPPSPSPKSSRRARARKRSKATTEEGRQQKGSRKRALFSYANQTTGQDRSHRRGPRALLEGREPARQRAEHVPRLRPPSGDPADDGRASERRHEQRHGS